MFETWEFNPGFRHVKHKNTTGVKHSKAKTKITIQTLNYYF